MGILSKVKKIAQKTFGAVEDATGMDSLGGKIFGSDNDKKKSESALMPDPQAEANKAVIAAQADAGVAELERKRRVRAASLLSNPQSAASVGTGTLLGG